MKIDSAATLRGNNFEPCSYVKTSVTENEKGKSRDISDIDDNVSNLIFNFDDSIDYMNLCDADRKFIDNHLQITKNVSKGIEKKKQSNCEQWYRERKIRITAFSFGVIINRRKELYPLSILKNLTGVNKKFTNDATKWGLENENKVISKYDTVFNKKVSTCDLIVNPKWLWLGCSSDGTVQVQKAIEIKCPSKFRDLNINECCHDKKFFMTSKANIKKSQH